MPPVSAKKTGVGENRDIHPYRPAAPAKEFPDLPPMPEQPDDWNLQEPASFQQDSKSANPPAADPADLPSMIIAPPAEKPVSLQVSAEARPDSIASRVIPVLSLPRERPELNLPVEKGSSRMLTIILRATDDKNRDIRRLKRILGMVRSSPGNDRFCFQMFENSHHYLLDFPNDTIGITHELVRQLADCIGDENIQIEIIKLQ